MKVKTSVKKNQKRQKPTDPKTAKEAANLHENDCPLRNPKLHEAGKMLLDEVLKSVAKESAGKEVEKFTVKMGALFNGGHYLITVEKMSLGEMMLKGILNN